MRTQGPATSGSIANSFGGPTHRRIGAWLANGAPARARRSYSDWGEAMKTTHLLPVDRFLWTLDIVSRVGEHL